MPEKDLLKPVYDLLDRFESITEDTQNELVTELRKTTESEIAYHKAQVIRIRCEIDRIKGGMNNLLDAFIDPNNKSITKDTYDKKHQEAQDKVQILEIELSEHTKGDFEYQNTVATVVSLARRAKSIFESSEVHEKRAILSYLLQNSTVNEKKLYFTIASPFNLVLDLANHPNWLLR